MSAETSFVIVVGLRMSKDQLTACQLKKPSSHETRRFLVSCGGDMCMGSRSFRKIVLTLVALFAALWLCTAGLFRVCPVRCLIVILSGAGLAFDHLVGEEGASCFAFLWSHHENMPI